MKIVLGMRRLGIDYNKINSEGCEGEKRELEDESNGEVRQFV